MDKKGAKLYLRLFTETFALSAFTFGGGYVIVPLMKKRFVGKLHWIEEEEMIDIISVSQAAPGAIAVNASMLLGYKMAGLPGAVITVLGTILPPVVVMGIVTYFYQVFVGNRLVACVLTGARAGVTALMADAVIGLGQTALSKKGALNYVILAAAFGLSFFFHISSMLIIISCGAAGLLTYFYRRKAGNKI